jgi:hypothetical protein
VNAFANHVRRLAAEFGGQDKLAFELGVSQGTVSRWTQGTTPKNMDLVSRVAQLARLSVDEVLTSETPAPIARAGKTILLPVSLPSEDVLQGMFEALLDRVPQPLRDELAQMLAARLPTALSRATNAPPVRVRSEAPGIAGAVAPTHQPPHRPI